MISPVNYQVIKEGGFARRDISKLQVLAPPGASVSDGGVVVVRGEYHIVRQRQSFDYSIGRPVLRRHQPKVVFIVERGEVSENVA